MTRDLPLSVNVSLPADCEDLIRERVRTAEAPGEIEVWTTVIHGALCALWEMRNRRKTKAELRHEVEEAILEGINSGPGIPKCWCAGLTVTRLCLMVRP